MSQRRLFIFSVLLVFLVIVDRWLKVLALSGTTASIWIGHFVLFRNDHLVFSWPLPNTLAIGLMVVAIVAVLWLARQSWQQKNVVRLLSCLLMLLGAASNLSDRIRYGFVIDWAYLGRWWPVFNLADVMIAAGLLILIIHGSRLDKTRRVT